MFPEDVRKILQKLRRTIRDAAPQAEEVISYGIPSNKIRGFLVHFGAYRDHISFYPTPSPRRKFKSELSKCEGGKGAIRLKLDQSIPYTLVREILKLGVMENLSR